LKCYIIESGVDALQGPSTQINQLQNCLLCLHFVCSAKTHKLSIKATHTSAGRLLFDNCSRRAVKKAKGDKHLRLLFTEKHILAGNLKCKADNGKKEPCLWVYQLLKSSTTFLHT